MKKLLLSVAMVTMVAAFTAGTASTVHAKTKVEKCTDCTIHPDGTVKCKKCVPML